MKAIIRISGLVKMNTLVAETMHRLRLRKKYAGVIIDESRPEIFGMLKDVKDFVAFGDINEETLVMLVKARAKKLGNKNAKISDAEANKIAKEILSGKKMEELGLKPWFSLHPARGGINTKLHYPRGVLGNHKDKINELVRRML